MHFPSAVLRALALFVAFILVGVGLFLFDFYAFYDKWLTALLLVLTTAVKLTYFLRSVLSWIRQTVDSPAHLRQLMVFMALTILLIIGSFAIDYYCLYRIYPTSFRLAFGQHDPLGQLLTFFYLSAGVFSTAGSSEVYPTSSLGQFYVTGEMLIGYGTTVLIVANLSHLRHIYQQA